MINILDLKEVILELYSNYVISAYNKTKLIGIYQAVEFVPRNREKLNLNFEREISEFVDKTEIRFTQVINPQNYFDMPVKNLQLFLSLATTLGDDERFVDGNTLEITGMYDGYDLEDPITLSIHRIGDDDNEVYVLSSIKEHMHQKRSALKR